MMNEETLKSCPVRTAAQELIFAAHELKRTAEETIEVMRVNGVALNKIGRSGSLTGS